MDPADFVIVITTCSSEAEAQRITSELLNKRVAACVQSSAIKSTYWWQGKIESADEVRLLIKARESDYQQIQDLIKAAHTYENPEILAVNIAAGSPQYLLWLESETTR